MRFTIAQDDSYFSFHFHAHTQQQKEVMYTAVESSALNRDHNTFLLVDDGTVGKFGGEITFRGKFEKAVSEKYQVPVVTLVIQVRAVLF